MSTLQEPQRSTITVADRSILHYETHGKPDPSKPSLVFLHYYGGSPSTWSPLLCQPGMSSFHCITYHARGWAPSTGPDDSSAYSIKAMSLDLGAILHASGVDQNQAGFVLVGHSMGVKVAQHYAATSKPRGLKGLALVAPAPLGGVHFPNEVKRQQLSAYQSAESVRFVLDNVLTSGPGALSEEIKEQCIKDSLRGNSQAKAAWPWYCAAEDYEGLESEIKAPVIALRGDQDFEKDLVGLLGVSQGRSNQAIADCGHLIPLEQPSSLAKAVLSFLQSL